MEDTQTFLAIQLGKKFEWALAKKKDIFNEYLA